VLVGQAPPVGLPAPADLGLGGSQQALHEVLDGGAGLQQPERLAVATAAAKRPLPAAGRVRPERFCEGRAAQVLHRGPYSAEGPTIERLHGFIAEQGLRLRGKHHEIYLTDSTRTAPERLKTVIRQPVAD
jgi:hypothetical protein